MGRTCWYKRLCIYLSVHRLIFRSIRLSVWISICYRSVCLFVFFICLSIYLSIFPSTQYISISLSIILSVHPSVCLSVYLSTCLPSHLSVYPSFCDLPSTWFICLSVHRAILPSVYVCLCLSIVPFKHLSIYIFFWLPVCLLSHRFTYMSVCLCLSGFLSIYPSFYLSIHLFVCLCRAIYCLPVCL